MSFLYQWKEPDQFSIHTIPTYIFQKLFSIKIDMSRDHSSRRGPGNESVSLPSECIDTVEYFSHTLFGR